MKAPDPNSMKKPLPSMKKPSPTGVIIGFVVTIVLLITSLDVIENLWLLYVVFFAWDISSLVAYIMRKKTYDRMQNFSAVSPGTQALTSPAQITVVREHAAVASGFPFSVCVNGAAVGTVADSGVFRYITNVNYNVLNFFDGAGNLFNGEIKLSLAPNDAAEVHIKGGKILKELTRVMPGGYFSGNA